MNNFHVIYHFWSFDSNFDFFKDCNNPIILSIATWRLYNKDIPITVLDVSNESVSIDWDYFSNLLNFNVIKCRPFIDNRFISRTWDIWECANKVPEENIIFNDADIFWLKDPFPLEKQKTNGCLLEGLHCGGNTGVFYFNKKSQLTRVLFELWKKKSFEAISGHPDMEEYNKKHHPDCTLIIDERIYRMLSEKYEFLYRNMKFSDNENFQFFNSYFLFLRSKKREQNYYKDITIKNIHPQSNYIKNKKMFFAFIEELNNIKKLFPKKIWEKFFSEEDIEKIFRLKIKKLSIEEFANLSTNRVFDYLSAVDFNCKFLS